jgi:hypothetical protein
LTDQEKRLAGSVVEISQVDIALAELVRDAQAAAVVAEQQ